MIQFLEVHSNGLLAILSMMGLLWLCSLWLRNSSIVDIFWSIGFLLATAVYFLQSTGLESRKILVFVLIILWALRLALHIGTRNWGKPEDFRYQNWRQQHGPRWWWLSFFQVFLLQGLLAWIIVTPILMAFWGARPLSWVDALGLLVWCVGFVFESLGDWQLMQFKAKPENKGKLLTTGVWRYTRHPNYFGEAALWWGFYCFALAAGGWWTIFSPLLLTWLLLRVSGVKMLEEALIQTKPGYEDYLRTTNAFIPGMPKAGPKAPSTPRE